MAGAVSSLVLAFVLLWPWRHTSPHVEAVLTSDYLRGASSDESIRAELEAAGPGVVDELRAELRRKLTWAERFLDAALIWLTNHGYDGFDDQRRSPGWNLAQRKRRAVTAVLLLGERAASARPEIEALKTRPMDTDLGNVTSALYALNPHDLATISNAVATLNHLGQPERFFLAGNFARIWTNPPAHLAALVERLKDDDEGVRSRAVRNLGGYGPVVSNVLPQLLPLLEDPSPMVRPLAAYAVGHIVPAEAPRAIRTMLAEQEVNDPARTNVGWIDLEPYRLYVELGPVARAAVPRLEQELTNPHYKSREGPIAFALWRITGETSPRIINALSRGAEARLERFKLFSLRGLKQIGPPASNAVPALERVVSQDHRVLIRREAQEALQAILRP